MKSCKWTTSRIEDYLEGELPASEILIFEGHVAECANCCREVELSTRLKQALHSLPEQEVPTDFVARIKQRILEEGIAAPIDQVELANAPLPRSATRERMVLLAAACLLIVLTSMYSSVSRIDVSEALFDSVTSDLLHAEAEEESHFAAEVPQTGAYSYAGRFVPGVVSVVEWSSAPDDFRLIDTRALSANDILPGETAADAIERMQAELHRRHDLQRRQQLHRPLRERRNHNNGGVQTVSGR
jgi:anti-sigma factor (TIGR02949 family)